MKKSGARQKGNAGEREWAKILNEKFGVKYHRTPLSGGMDLKGDIQRTYGSPPSRIDDFHWEVKRVEKLNVWKAMEQATRDCRNKIPTVAHRKNNSQWLVTLEAEDFLNIVKELEELSNE